MKVVTIHWEVMRVSFHGKELRRRKISTTVKKNTNLLHWEDNQKGKLLEAKRANANGLTHVTDENSLVLVK